MLRTCHLRKAQPMFGHAGVDEVGPSESAESTGSNRYTDTRDGCRSCSQLYKCIYIYI